MKRKMLCLFLATLLCLSVCLPAAAQTDYTQQAETLKSLGLFMGSEKGFELERAATRAEAAVMMVRLLGKEPYAKAQNLSHPFTDVPAWAGPYVGYLYQYNITQGVSASRFGADQTATAAQYGTYLLRALGYSDAKGDFSWDKSLSKLVSLGIITGADSTAYGGQTPVLRGHVAALSLSGLSASLKNSSLTLLEKLFCVDKSVTQPQITAAAKLDKGVAVIANKAGVPSPYPSTSALDSEQIYENCNKAVFMVETEYSEYGSGGGSGFFISADGVAVTNYHVIENIASGTIQTTDGKTHEIEGVLGVDIEDDLALIKIKGSHFPYLTIGDSTKLRQAQRIYCIGSPLGLINTISDGLVSYLDRELEDRHFIQISAPITYGSSGGALLNEYGQVVGVTSGGYGDANLNVAVPLAKLLNLPRYINFRNFRYFEAHARFGAAPGSVTKTETDFEKTAQSLLDRDVVQGSVSDTQDSDEYRFALEGKADMMISLTTDKEHSPDLRFQVVNVKTGKTLIYSKPCNEEIFSIAFGHIGGAGEYAIRVFVAEDSALAWDDLSYELFLTYTDQLYADDSYYRYHWVDEFEPNDTWEYADFIFSGESISGELSTPEDVDCFSFAIDTAGEYVVYNDSYYWYSASVNLDVYDPDGRYIGSAKTHEDYETSFFSKVLTPGTYYVIVTPGEQTDTLDDWLKQMGYTQEEIDEIKKELPEGWEDEWEDMLGVSGSSTYELTYELFEDAYIW